MRFHFQCCKPQLVGLLPTKYLWTYWYGLLQSLITGDLGQRYKVQSFLLNFSTSSNPSTLQVSTIHKINRVLLILLQILVKTFASNIIDLSYNLSKYTQFEVFEKCLHWVVYIKTLLSACITWIRMESCSNFCVS